jgi:hypothetical protein
VRPAAPRGRDEGIADQVADESTRQVRDELNTAASELGLWLASLRSFLSPKHQPGGAQAKAIERDYRCEAQALREILFRCLHLTSDLTGELGVRRRSTKTRGESGAPEAALTDEPANLDADALDGLGESLKGISALCDAALSSVGLVGFAAWSEIGGALQRTLDESAAARLLTARARDWSAPPANHRLAALAERVSAEEAAEDLQRVFEGFSHLLGLLSFAETSLTSDAPLKPLLAVFALIHEQTRELLDFVELVSRGEAGGEGIRDALDGTAYAVHMELRKTFEQELEGFCSAADPAHTYSRAESACGLLRNCFQQSVVAIAQSLEATIEGRELFDSFTTRLDESLQLRAELWSLIHFIRDAERRSSEVVAPVVAEGLYAFREGSLRYLMYKDREPFEKFLEEVETARGHTELAGALHRLGAFLETLFGQVNMRAALVNHPFDPQGVGLNFS